MKVCEKDHDSSFEKWRSSKYFFKINGNHLIDAYDENFRNLQKNFF